MILKIVSPLVKARLTDEVQYFPAYHTASALLGDRFYFSAVYGAPATETGKSVCSRVEIESALSEAITVCRVEHVPVRMPHYPGSGDEDYIGHEPGLYPDLLRPCDMVHTMPGYCNQLYFELNVPEDTAPGVYPITVKLVPLNGNEPISDTLELEILPAKLPAQTTDYAEWFHYDCLATYYGVEVFSERHWEIVESFVRTALKTGVTALLTPVFTPPLDTAVGGERPTVQLVDITVTKGRYAFGFDKLKRFCDMCLRLGVPKLEIAHLFTQWGAEHAPKIMATVDGEYKKIFGWETVATSEEYIGFLNEFIPAVKEKLDAFGYKDRYFFHISDEPNTKHLGSYTAARNAVWHLISDHPVRDALSHYEFYEKGIVTEPIPVVSHADEFVAHNVPDLWVYYCCSPGSVCSNRFIAMSATRTRVIGAQMYKAGVTGFLHWGYNFYYSQHSRHLIDPYTVTDGDYFGPAGDPFAVYPAVNGTALCSLRSALFEQALYDMRAMALAEQVSGREAVIAAIDRAGATDFRHYSTDPQRLLALREEINHLAVEK